MKAQKKRATKPLLLGLLASLNEAMKFKARCEKIELGGKVDYDDIVLTALAGKGSASAAIKEFNRSDEERETRRLDTNAKQIVYKDGLQENMGEAERKTRRLDTNEKANECLHARQEKMGEAGREAFRLDTKASRTARDAKCSEEVLKERRRKKLQGQKDDRAAKKKARESAEAVAAESAN